MSLSSLLASFPYTDVELITVRYVPQVEGVLLSHWNHDFLDDTVGLINECPFGVVDVEFKTLVWAPKLGQKLCMSILCSTCLPRMLDQC